MKAQAGFPRFRSGFSPGFSDMPVILVALGAAFLVVVLVSLFLPISATAACTSSANRHIAAGLPAGIHRPVSTTHRISPVP